ncbi:1118_t:CDS:2, partial [Ambispora gerdemannii]
MAAQKTEFTKIVENSIAAISDDLREISLKIRAKPEIALEEHFAHNLLTDYLEKKGFKVTRKAYGLNTAFRAEYESEVTGVMNALKALSIPGKVVLFRTPAEEIVSGKVELIEAGAYKEVDVSLMVHPAWGDLLDPVYLAITSAKIEYFGKAAHAAGTKFQRPLGMLGDSLNLLSDLSFSMNALDAVVLAYNGILLLRQQSQINNRISMFITNGGKVVNVIPDYASLQVQILSESVSILQELKSRIEIVSSLLRTLLDAHIKLSGIKDDAVLAKSFMKHMEDRGVVYPPTGTFPPGGSTDQAFFDLYYNNNSRNT